MKAVIWLCFIFFAMPVWAQGPGKVGVATRPWTDETRSNWAGTDKRPLLTMIWYPADKDAKEEACMIPPTGPALFAAGTAAKNAKFADSTKKYPLVVMSHGTGGSALQMMWLGQALAAQGFVVAAANHHGNTGAEKEKYAQAFALWWERTRDLSAIIDKVLADPELAPHIDLDRIGAAGFSLGGYTVVSLAGGITDWNAYLEFCQSPEHDFTCEPQAEFPSVAADFAKLLKTDKQVIESMQRSGNSYRDKRVKAVFALAPALGHAFTEKGLAPIEIPLQIVVGEGDKVTPRATNAEWFAKRIKTARLSIIPGKVGHYTFLGDCTERGKELVPLCADEPGVDRQQVHTQVSALAVAFFQKQLGEKRKP